MKRSQKVFKYFLLLLLLSFYCGCTKKPEKVQIITDVSQEVITVGDTITLSAVVDPKGSDQTVTWSSANRLIATVNDKGVLTAHSFGSVMISARSTVNTTLVDTIEITITDQIRIAFESDADYLLVGRSNRQRLVAYDSNHNYLDVFWETDDPSIATITANGDLTGVSNGIVTITAYSEENLIKEGTMEVKVYDVPTSIKTADIDDLYEINTEIKLEATILPATAEQTCEFASSDESVATVDNDGTIIAMKAGTAEITITAKSKTTIRKTVTINVCNSFLTEEKFTSTDTYLKTCFTNETIENITLPTSYNETGATIRWASSNSNVISNEGIVTQQKINVTITLTATVNINNETRIFEYTTVVKRLNSSTKLTFIYVATWGFSGFRSGDLDKIDYINISFATIARNNSGNYTTSLSLPSDRVMNAMLEAKESGVGVILSIGGWGAGGFSEAASSQTTRSALIDSIMAAVKKYDLDGIDLDWEYPTSSSAGIVATSQDRNNFTLLCKELREAMNEYKIGLLLTAATVCGSRSSVNKCYDLAALNNYLDYINIMTYDMSSQRGHHTNLYSSTIPNASSSSAHEAVLAYTSLGFDIDKLVIGCAFYGKVLQVSTEGQYHGLGIRGTKVEYEGDSDGWDYSLIKSVYLDTGTVTEYFDESSQASWLYGNNIFISCDTATSIAAKCDYVNENDLGGIMAWEYTQDTNSSELLNAIYANINK